MTDIWLRGRRHGLETEKWKKYEKNGVRESVVVYSDSPPVMYIEGREGKTMERSRERRVVGT